MAEPRARIVQLIPAPEGLTARSYHSSDEDGYPLDTSDTPVLAIGLDAEGVAWFMAHNGEEIRAICPGSGHGFTVIVDRRQRLIANINADPMIRWESLCLEMPNPFEIIEQAKMLSAEES